MKKSPATSIGQNIYQVSEFTSEVRSLLETSYPQVWIEGELSNLAQPASGHLYFSLKDSKAQIRCAFFRNRISRLHCKPENGLKVKVCAQVSLYENRGDFQLIISHMEPAGRGDLQQAFEQLKSKLAAEGLFSPEHKVKLPRFPDCIGVITSASGAAIKDIISACARRYPTVKLLIYPTQVQGEQAATQIAAAINQADKEQRCDLLIVGRGGGSLEDLWAFNEEVVARAIFACQTPVISAVGHDIDFSIADFVADMRASTPTSAAELATPDQNELMQQFIIHQNRLKQLIRNTLINRIQRTDLLSRRLLHPKEKLNRWSQLNIQLSARLQQVMQRRIEQHDQSIKQSKQLLMAHAPDKMLTDIKTQVHNLTIQASRATKQQLVLMNNKFSRLNDKLVAISPQSTLERGYAIVSDELEGAIMRSVQQTHPQQRLCVKLADGEFNVITQNESVDK